MADIIIQGPAGRLEAKYHRSYRKEAPIALVLHPHPIHGGSMHSKPAYTLYHAFAQEGFNVLRFNFRGVGKSEGVFDNGEGELSDAAAALDWLQADNRSASAIWVAGFSFGAWITLQMLMRRPEIDGFLAISPPVNMYDFNFLAPCPITGLIVQGGLDTIVPPEAVKTFFKKLAAQKNSKVEFMELEKADHFFTNLQPQLSAQIKDYLRRNVKFV